jgi:hypothetical protein
MTLLGTQLSNVPLAILLVPLILSMLAALAFIKIDSHSNTDGERALISYLDNALDGSVVHPEQT